MKITTGSILALAFSFFVLASAASAQTTCGKEDYTCQIADYTRQIQDEPKNDELYYNRGRAFLGVKNYDRAIQDFSRYVVQGKSKDEYKADGYNFLGNCYKGKSDGKNAISNYTEAIRLNPSVSLYYLNRGKMYNDQKLFAVAITDQRVAWGKRAAARIK